MAETARCGSAQDGTASRCHRTHSARRAQALRPRRVFGWIPLDDRAQVGIGTMIVFIATILVAATATAVMLDTAGQLQKQASRTGDESTQNVASTLYLEGIYGKRDTTSAATISTLNVTVTLAPAAGPVDLSRLVIRLGDGANTKHLTYGEGATGDGDFAVSVPRDDDGSFSTNDPVLNQGDLANLQVNLTNQGMGLTTRTGVTLLLQPEVGPTVHAGFTTPASYGVKQVIVLR